MTRARPVPEVVAASEADRGPVAIQAILEGLGLPVDPTRLREAFVTELDGTSMAGLEDAAIRLGMDAEREVVPKEHVFLDPATDLPALVRLRSRDGVLRVGVAWKSRGKALEFLDPDAGRRWIRCDEFLDSLHETRERVPAAAWREQAGSERFERNLLARMAGLGVPPERAERLGRLAREDSGWGALGALDAAIRLVEKVVSAGGLERGEEATRVLRRVLKQVADGDAGVLPSEVWSVSLAEPDADGREQVWVRGIECIRIRGVIPAGTGDHPELPPGVLASVLAGPVRPWRVLGRFLAAEGRGGLALLLPTIGLAGAGVVVEALLLRGLLDLGTALGIGTGRLAAFGILVGLCGLLAVLDGWIASAVLRMGRHLGVRLRMAVSAALRRDCGRPPFPIAELAERGQAASALADLPRTGSDAGRTLCELLLTAAGLAWLSPGVAYLPLMAAVAAVAVPVIAQNRGEVLYRTARTRAGALARFYLEGLVGAVPIHLYGAEETLQQCHEAALASRLRAVSNAWKHDAWIRGIQSVSGMSIAALLVAASMDAEPASLLLRVYWALRIPVLGTALAGHWAALSSCGVVAQRFLELTGAGPVAESFSSGGRGMQAFGIRLEGVDAVSRGGTILTGLDVDIPAGAHVAVVGPSGSGKSSLLDLMRGRLPVRSGRVLLDGRTLDAESWAELGPRVSWVSQDEPLWNETLLRNLQYRGDSGRPIAEALESSGLHDRLSDFPAGLQTGIGDRGGLLCAGDGRRIRFGRALMAPAPSLVLLDDPFRGLDRGCRRFLLDQARQAWRGATLVFATCDVDDTRGFDRVLVMDGGRIVEDGEPQALSGTLGSRYATLFAEAREAARAIGAETVFRHVRLEEGRLTGALPATERELERGAWTDTVFRHLRLRDPEDPGERS